MQEHGKTGCRSCGGPLGSGAATPKKQQVHGKAKVGSKIPVPLNQVYHRLYPWHSPTLPPPHTPA